MKKLATFAFVLVLALASFTLLAPADVDANSCYTQYPYGAASVQECFALCADKGCGIDRWESSTNCCWCGEQY